MIVALLIPFLCSIQQQEEQPRSVWLVSKITIDNKITKVSDKYCFTVTVPSSSTNEDHPSFLIGFSTEEQAGSWLTALTRTQSMVNTEIDEKRRTWAKSQQPHELKMRTSFVGVRKPSISSSSPPDS